MVCEIYKQFRRFLRFPLIKLLNVVTNRAIYGNLKAKLLFFERKELRRQVKKGGLSVEKRRLKMPITD